MPSAIEITQRNLLKAHKDLADYYSKHAQSNPSYKNDLTERMLRKQYFQNLLDAHAHIYKSRDQFTVTNIRNQLRRLFNSLRPINIIYTLLLLPFRILAAIIDFAALRTVTSLRYRHEISNIHKDNFKAQNLERIRRNLKASGFTRAIDSQLANSVNQNRQKFDIHYSDPRYPNTDFTLHFLKNSKTGSYNFEKYTASYRPSENALSMNNSSKPTINVPTSMTADPITASEANDLLLGKPIYRNFAGRDTWLTLAGPKNSNSSERQIISTPMDIGENLSKLPIKELSDPAKRNMIKNSLRTGKKASVTLQTNQGPVSAFLEPSPKTGSFQITDKLGNKIDEKDLKPINPAAIRVLKAAYEKKQTQNLTQSAQKSRHRIH